MRTRLRTSKMSIETPNVDSEAWVHVTVQQVLEDDDGKVLNVIPRFDYISKPLSEFVMDINQYEDPVLGGSGTISGGGIASVLTNVVSEWIKNEHNGAILEDGSIIIGGQ